MSSRFAFAVLIAVAASLPARAQDTAPAEALPALIAPPTEPRHFDLSSTWSDGLSFSSADDAFRIHIGGNAQIDSTWLIGPDSAFELPNGSTSGIGGSSATFLRRVRLRMQGDLYEQFDYIVEYDFANATNDSGSSQPQQFGSITGSPSPANVWMQVRDVPYFGNLRFGHQAKPIGFSTQVYQGFLPFLERADTYDAFQGSFDNGHSIGLTSRNHSDDERLTWQFGIYRPLVNVFGVAVNKMQWGGRITALPVDADDGRKLVHVGLGTLNGERPQNQLRARARPLLRNGPGYTVPVIADTGEIGGNREYIVTPEFAAVLGQWSVQAEWTGQWLTQATTAQGLNVGTAFYHGGFVEVLCFLTGEHQPYDKANGAFGRVIPRRNLRTKRGEGWCGGGAWQVGVRCGYLDLNDKAIAGGQLWDVTAGVNWFWNPNMKVQLNYILERRDQPGVAPAWINGVGVRGAYDF